MNLQLQPDFPSRGILRAGFKSKVIGHSFSFKIWALHFRCDDRLAKLELAKLIDKMQAVSADDNLIVAGDWNLRPDQVDASLPTDGETGTKSFVLCSGGPTNLPLLTKGEELGKERDYFVVHRKLFDKLMEKDRQVLTLYGRRGDSEADPATSTYRRVYVLKIDELLKRVAESSNLEQVTDDGFGCIPFHWLLNGLSEIGSSALPDSSMAAEEDETIDEEHRQRSRPAAEYIGGFSRSGWPDHRMVLLELL